MCQSRVVSSIAIVRLATFLLLLLSTSPRPAAAQFRGPRESINRLAARAANRAVDPSQPRKVTAQAGTGLAISPVGASLAITGRLGGATKSSYSLDVASSTQLANVSADAADGAVGAPGFGRVSTRSGLDTLVMSQRRLGPPRNSSLPGNTSLSGNSSSAPRPAETALFDVLLAAASDYTTAGDRGSVFLNDEVIVPGLPRRRPNSRRIYGLDYDYGGPGLIPAATTGVAMRNSLDDKARRASAGGVTGGSSTAPSVRARSHATSSSLRGIVAARDTAGDIFTTPLAGSVVATPPVLVRQAGADAAVAANALGSKASLRPSVVTVRSSADSSVDADSPAGTGARSSILSYAAGLASVETSAQTAALGLPGGLAGRRSA